MRELSSSARIEEQNGVFSVINIKESLELRLTRLSDSGQLLLGDAFHNNIFLCFSGDKGGASTKCSITIGNVLDPNSVDNLLLVGFYDGDDKASNLRSSFSTSTFKQVNEIKELAFKCDGNDVTMQVKWFITGDMKFLCALYGHLGAIATHPCLFCEAEVSHYKETAIFPARTLQSMTAAAMDFAAKNNFNLGPKDRTKLNRSCKSVTMHPALDIPLANVIPSSLHIVQGLGQDLIGLLEKFAKQFGGQELVKSLELVYKQLGADKEAWFQKFTGNHLRKLLTGQGPAKMIAVVKRSQLTPALLQLFQLLGRIQGFAKASFLSDAEIVEFEQLAHNYYDAFRINFPAHSITSKAHWLVVHVPHFMKHWRFWGLMSEQPIEALHHQVNRDKARFASMRSGQLIHKKCMEQSCLRNALFDLKISHSLIPPGFS